MALFSEFAALLLHHLELVYDRSQPGGGTSTSSVSAKLASATISPSSMTVTGKNDRGG